MLDDKTWNEIKKLWGADLDKPTIFQTQKEAQKRIGDEIAAFDSSNNRIMVSAEKLDEKVGKEFLGTVVSHEVGHYAMIPYDLATLMSLVNSADKVLKNVKLAKYVENLFADTVLNTFIYRNEKSTNPIDRKIVKLYEKMSGDSSNSPDAWKLYLRSYEKLWNLPDKTLATNVSNKVDNDAQSISDLLTHQTFLRDNWNKRMKTYTEILEPYLRDENQQKKELGKGILLQPQDPKQMKDIAGNIKKAAKSMSKKQIKRIVTGLGLGTPQQANRWFYESKSQSYAVHLPRIMSMNSGTFPFTPKRWNFSDPISELDIAYSIQQAGAILPGSTYQWTHRESEGRHIQHKKPDLLILLDTSGSMGDPNKYVSNSVIASMAASRCALNTGSKVGVINFSCKSKTLYHTTDKKKIDDLLLHHQNGGTNLPTQEVLDVLDRNKQKPNYLLMITDTAASNLKTAKEYYQRASKKICGGTILLVDTVKNQLDSFEKMGYNVHPILDEKDLIGLTIKQTKEVYA